MKKVVLFKSESEEYEKAFLDVNYETLFVEPLQFDFINKGELSNKLSQKDYSGLILTSPRAVEAVSKCWDPTRFVIWNTKKIYTVGEASRYKIKLLLGLEAVGATSGSGENLANIITKENPENTKFLFPCGNLKTEILPNILKASNITVDALTVYETKENDNLRSELMAVSERADASCMVFFSPSGCEYISRQLQTFSNNLSQLPHFAIGNTTAHKIENLGIEVAGVAAQPKADSLVEAVNNYFVQLHTS